jgi:hypothetical protein
VAGHRTGDKPTHENRKGESGNPLLKAGVYPNNHAVFSKNRERLLNEEIAESFFERVLVRGGCTIPRSGLKPWPFLHGLLITSADCET